MKSSDNLGLASVNLNSGTFLVTAIAPGYIFPAFHSLVISGAKSDTLKGYGFDPGAPADPAVVRVYGWVRDISGQPDNSATISATLPAGVTRTNGTIISPFEVSRATDSVGYFYLDVIPNMILAPDTTKYEFSLRRGDGTILRKGLVAPDSATWRLSW